MFISTSAEKVMQLKVVVHLFMSISRILENLSHNLHKTF